MVATISPSMLADLRRRGEKVTLVDVRTPAEFGEVHVDFAHNIPLDRLDAEEVGALAGGGPVYVICKSGTRSQKACEKLAAAGLERIVSVAGGTAACVEAGLPVERGRKVMALERQVRIAAGLLVAAGAALAGLAPDPTWKAIGAGLAGFVGCGLVFAGVTDSCAMGMLIARMPWNTVCTSGGSCCRTAVLGLVLGAMAGTALAEHTKDSLDTVKRAVAEKKAILVDVREPEEWEQGHVVGAKLVPLSALEKGIDAQELARVLPKDKVVYCHCLAGGRCLDAAAILAPLGYDVRPLKPGYPQLEKAGFPTAKGR